MNPIGSIKLKVRRWLYPELDLQILHMKQLSAKAESYLVEMEAARNAITALSDKYVVISGPAVFLGNVENCAVEVKPEVKPTIVLSQLKLAGMLSATGNHQTITSSVFNYQTPPEECL